MIDWPLGPGAVTMSSIRRSPLVQFIVIVLFAVLGVHAVPPKNNSRSACPLLRLGFGPQMAAKLTNYRADSTLFGLRFIRRIGINAIPADGMFGSRSRLHRPQNIPSSKSALLLS